jgi:phosphate uptake regulator
MCEEYLKSVIKYLQDEKNAIVLRENKLIKKIIEQGKKIQDLEAKILNQRLTKIFIDDSPAEFEHIKTFCGHLKMDN